MNEMLEGILCAALWLLIVVGGMVAAYAYFLIRSRALAHALTMLELGRMFYLCIVIPLGSVSLLLAGASGATTIRNALHMLLLLDGTALAAWLASEWCHRCIVARIVSAISRDGSRHQSPELRADLARTLRRWPNLRRRYTPHRRTIA